MRLKYILLAGMMLLPSAVAAKSQNPARATHSAGLPAQPVVNLNYRQYDMANGLKLIVHEDHTAPIATIAVYYHVGSRDETPGRTGFAHLFEHLMFGGSENAKGHWISQLSSIGGSNYNGTTSFDRTNFFETVPATSLDRALWLESDRMGHLLGAVDQAKLDEQRGVVQNEKRQRENNPFGAVPDTVSKATYPAGHPYSWQPIGSMVDLDAATLDDVKSWFRTWYGPSNATLVVSGDVNPDNVRSKVERYFGDIPAGPALKRTDNWVAKMTGEKRGTVEVTAPTGHVMKIWNVPGFGTRDAEILGIAADILGGGPDSRLYQRLVYQDKLASSAAARVELLELGSHFTVDVAAKPGGDLNAIERVVNEELARFLRDGPTPQELQRYKFQTYAEMVRTADNPGGSASLLVECQVYTGNTDCYRTAQAWEYAATPADVKDTAAHWLSDGFYVLRVVPLPNYITAPATDRSRMPNTGAPPAIALVPPRRFTLSNGLKVQLVERHDAPLVRGELLFRAGAALEGDSLDAETPSLAALMTTEGTRTRSFTDIVEQQKSIGGAISWSSGDENTSFGFRALTVKLGETLDLWTDVLLNPTFPEPAFERRRNEISARIAQSKSVPEGKLGLIEGPLFFGIGHPYGKTPTQQGLAKLKLSEVRDWYDRWIRPDNATLLVVGDTTEAQIRPILEQRLAGWRAPPVPVPTPVPVPELPAPSAPRIYLIDQPGAEQSVIHTVDLTIGYTDPRLEAVDTADGVLDGFLGRLNMNLRESKHWSYGVRGGVKENKSFGTYNVSTSVQTDKTADAIRELDREFRAVLTTRKPTAEEIKVSKNQQILPLATGMQGVSGLAGFYRSLIEQGRPDDYWNGYISRVDGVTPVQVEDAFKLMLRPNEVTWFIAGDLSKIEAPIRALKMGEVQVVDVEGKILR